MKQKPSGGMVRESLELWPNEWRALEQLARETGCTYRGAPSWRRLIKRIARGDLIVTFRTSGNPPTSTQKHNGN